MGSIDVVTPRLEVVEFDYDRPFGISIIGDAQAGKTTLCRGLTDAWKMFQPDTEVVHFSNSDGFRGLTEEIITAAGIPADKTVTEDEAKRAIENFIDLFGICPERLDGYYHNPKPNEV